MINKILPFLNRLLPTKLAYDALQKANPKLKKFATGAIASGYTIDQTMDFLRDRFMPEETEDFGGRPDEKAAAQQVKNSKQLPKALATGATLAGGALGGLAALGMGGDEEQQEEHQNPMMRGAKQIPSKAALQDEMQPQIIPPRRMNENPKQEALQKFQQHQQPQKKQKMADELYDQFQQGYGNKKQYNQMNDPLYQALYSGDVGEVGRLAGVNQTMAIKLIQNFNQKQGQPQQQTPQQGGQGGQGQQALMAILQKIQQQRGG